MILVCIQDNIYLTWQAELLIYNVHKLNKDEDVVILSGYRNKPSTYALSMFKIFKNFHMIEDTRTSLHYAPSIQPHLISKFLKSGAYKGYYNNQQVFLVDSDIYLKSLDMLKPTNEILFSDTSSYLNASYVNGTDPDILKEMCKLTNTNYDFVMSCDKRAGGAHYILPSLYFYEFWDVIEQNCYKLYDFMCQYKCKNHDIQKWTASMWAILWSIYGLEQKGIINCMSSMDLDFCWATDNIVRFDSTNILHLAGVTENLKENHFYKGNYTTETPFSKNFDHVKQDLCCYKYCQLIDEYSKIRYEFSTI